MAACAKPGMNRIRFRAICEGPSGIGPVRLRCRERRASVRALRGDGMRRRRLLRRQLASPLPPDSDVAQATGSPPSRLTLQVKTLLEALRSRPREPDRMKPARTIWELDMPMPLARAAPGGGLAEP